MKDLPDIQDRLADAIALTAFLQHVTIESTGPTDEQSRNGLFLFVTNILDKLKEVEKHLDELKNCPKY